MKPGFENKRNVAILGGLGLLLAYAFYANVLSGPSAPSSGGQVAAPRPDAGASALPSPVAAAAPRLRLARGRTDEFHPVLRSKRPEERINPLTVDPTVHFELLAKLDEAQPEANGRNLFQFGPPPPPPAAAKKAAEALKGPEPIVAPKPPEVKLPAAEPPPPPIPLKYYGLSTIRASGKKTAFFLDEDKILTAAEGDIVKKRYKVVRIGVNSVVMEDMELKRQQSVPLAEDANVPG